jgi:hypothetical protein
MKIRYKRTGGIANITKHVEIDSTELPDHLQTLLDSLKPIAKTEPLRSDDFFHELYLEDGRIIRCTESQCSPELLELLSVLATLR